eukprot:TRINITY_DN7571_c0_g1_i1.p1 TRINITY_DN7571_c0_g1~~TRINITY_DN7571_c0_g1_i1.p1  ORF type:complete len:248 (-),score=41.31 TRINITY_DN7571_c0_g1_i1:15-758(-)
MKRAPESEMTTTPINSDPFLCIELEDTFTSLQQLRDLKYNTSVQILDLYLYPDYNSSLFFDPINEALAMNTSITILNLLSNGVDEFDFPLAFRNVHSLGLYDFDSEDTLSSKGYDIIEVLRSNTTLKTLQLTRCCESFLVDVVEGLECNSSITNLILKNISLPLQSIKKIGEILQNNKSITIIDFQGVCDESFVETILKSIKLNKTLTSIKIKMNGRDLHWKVKRMIDAYLKRNNCISIISSIYLYT